MYDVTEFYEGNACVLQDGNVRGDSALSERFFNEKEVVYVFVTMNH